MQQAGLTARAACQSQTSATLLIAMLVQVRCAGCVWLVSLVSFAAGSGAVAPRLLDIQEAFGSLLGDSGELTQVRSAPALHSLSTWEACRTCFVEILHSPAGGLKCTLTGKLFSHSQPCSGA